VTIVIDTSKFAGLNASNAILYYFSDLTDTTGEQVPGCSAGPLPSTGCVESVTPNGPRVTFVVKVDGGPGIDPTYAG
jgi:hypothetical protein